MDNEQKLREIWGNKQAIEVMYNFIIDYLNRMAIVRVYERKETAHIPDAKAALDGAMTELHERFDPKKPIKPRNPR